MKERKKITPTKNKSQNNIIKKQYEKPLKVMALGGLGEVGKNCYVVEYNNNLFVIDYGVLFPDKDLLGIDYIIPNFNYLIENQDKIRGLFITHGHEDHIGGIPFLLKKIKIPCIYAPKTALLMIQKKLKEHKINAKLEEINDHTTLKFKDVVFHSFRQTHSIPDSLGFFIETPIGNIATTGDFKVDFSPPGQKSADFHKMVEFSKKGLLCLLSDSTNALTSGFSLSESLIGKNLKLLIKEAKGRIIFTTFASNINRVQQIIEGAIENNKKICILGRSLTNGLQIGLKTGYIKAKKNNIIEPRDIKKYNDDEIVIITTGSQGETMAALSRIVTNMHPHIEIKEEDTVVFASNPIPGNNYQIGKVIDNLARSNCNIIVNSDIFKTHASGHASIEEQKLLLSLWQPKYFAPIHGTYMMQNAHKHSAMDLGIKEENIFLLNNGDVLEFYKNKKPIVKRNVFPGESLYISGNNIDVQAGNGVMEKLASDGIFIINAIYHNKKLVSYPNTLTRGFITINNSIDLIKETQQIFLETYHKNKHLKPHLIENKIKKELKTLFNNMQKNPMIKVKLIDFNSISIDEQKINKEI